MPLTFSAAPGGALVGRSQARGRLGATGFVQRSLFRRAPQAIKRPRQCTLLSADASLLAHAAPARAEPDDPVVEELQPVRRFAASAASLSRPQILWAVLSVSVCVACGLRIPILLGKTMTALIAASQTPGPEPTRRFLRSLSKVVMLFICECVAARFYVANMTKVADVAVKNLRVDTYGSISNGVDASFFDSIPASTATSSMSDDAKRVRDLVWGCLQRDRGVRAVADMTLGICVVFALSPVLASIYLVCVPLVASFSTYNGLRLAKLMGKESQAQLKATRVATEALSSWKTVLSFGTEMRELSKYHRHLDEVDARYSMRLRGMKALQEFSARFSIVVVLCSFLFVGGGLVAYGAIPLQTYLSSQSFVWTMTFAVQGVIYSISDGSEIAGALRRIYSVIDHADRASLRLAEFPRSAVGSLPQVRGSFRLENVSFAYPSRPEVNVLSSLCLDIEAGKTTALVGLSGSGKSTIASLLLRFYTPNNGAILLDGTDITTLDRTWFSEQIGFVSQQPILFSGTVREAIAYGAPDHRQPIPDDVVVEAAKLANAYDFITALPQGFDTEVGERGSRFSGGQLQRIAIARAIVRKSKIFLLDEATSALDSESESKVQEALDRLTRGKTCLVIAHRLSTIRDAAKIVVLGAGGRVLETGTYDGLLTRNGAFSKLMNTQTVVIGE